MVAVIQEICPSLIQLIRGLWVLLEAKQLLKGQGLLVVYEQGASLQRVKKLAILNNSQTFFIYPLSPLGLVDKNKSLQSCPTLQPHRWQPTRPPVPGILQARTLEWDAISFSNAWKWKVKGKSLSRVRLFGTPWTAAYQAPPSMGFSRQEYWSGVPLPSLSSLLSYVK